MKSFIIKTMTINKAKSIYLKYQGLFNQHKIQQPRSLQKKKIKSKKE